VDVEQARRGCHRTAARGCLTTPAEERLTTVVQANASAVSGHALKVLVLGASGTIGAATVRALVRRGHQVVCLVRHRQGANAAQANQAVADRLLGATVRWGDACDPVSLLGDGFADGQFDAVVSCMASRTGAPQDAWRVDHQAHVDALKAAQSAGVKQFVLLSAICVQKPLLAFQQAKLAFEQTLIDSGMTYAIVRPTAFFKSLSGQVQRVKNGKAFLLFGDGRRTACKPISDDDLGDFIAGCLDQPDRQNRILPIGGPGPAITPREQGEHLFKLMGLKPRFTSVPVGMLDLIISALSLLGRVSPAAAGKAELARIGRYYATESMLVFDTVKQQYDAVATPSHGTQTLFDAYELWIKNDEAPDRGEHKVF